MPLGVGDFIVGDAAYDFLSVVNDAAVVGTIPERKSDVLGPFVGFLVPVRTLLSRGHRRFRAGNQTLVEGDSGLRFAVIAASEQESLPMAEIDDGNRVRLAIRRKMLRRSDLQRAPAADFHDVRKIVRIWDGAEIGISRTCRSDSERRHALAVENIRDGKTRDARLDSLFGLCVHSGFVFVIEARAQEENSRADSRNSSNPDEDLTELFVVDREHKDSGRKYSSEYSCSESHGNSPFPNYSGLNKLYWLEQGRGRQDHYR